MKHVIWFIAVFFAGVLLHGEASAQSTASITSFTTPSAVVSSSDSIGVSWDIANASGYNLLISCGAGITLKRTDGSAVSCNTTISNASAATDALDLFVYNVYGSTQTVTFTLTPIDTLGAVVTGQSQVKSVLVATEQSPLGSFTTSSQTSVVYSNTPFTVSWEGRAGLTNVNFKINCQDFLSATTSSYLSGNTILPCDTPIFSSDLAGSSGSLTFSALNRAISDATLTITILPGTGTGIYDGIHSRSLTFTIKPPRDADTASVTLTSSKSTIASGSSALLSWSATNASGFNLSIACYEGVSITTVLGTSTTAVPCTNLAFSDPLPASGSLSLLFYSSANFPVPVTITGVPQLSNGSYDGIHSKAITLSLSPTSTSQSVVSPTIGTSPAVPTTVVSNKKVTLLTKQLVRGSKNSEVTILQTYLSLDKTLYPESAISGLYGPATEKAVQRFQLKYGLAKKGVMGYGQVGPKTRAKLNELLSK